MRSPKDIALDMGQAEKDGDVQALERYLHKDLIFSRADGSIVDRMTFLGTVKERDHLDLEVLEDEEEDEADADSAVVTLIVRTHGASFRNVRVFVRDGQTWRCRLWVNTKLDTPPLLKLEMLHHVSLPMVDLERSRRFYEDVLGLRESKIPRPVGPSGFGFEGAWFQVGAGQLHLIVPKADPALRTFPENPGIPGLQRAGGRRRPSPGGRRPESPGRSLIGHFAVRFPF